SNRVVGLLGLGHVGQEVVGLLKPFACTVIATDIRDLSPFCREHGIDQVTLDVLLARSEVLSVHVPLTNDTRGMIGAEALGKMRTGGILVNTSRGGVVDERALLEALKSGALAGAALDVFAVEPPTDLELVRRPNVLATTHIGGSAEEAILAMGRAAI